MQINLFNDLYYSSFIFNAEVTEDILLSEYKGSAFRGGFGASFKKLVCINQKETDCKYCIVNKNCSYFKIFKTDIDANLAKKLSVARTAPHPFIIQQPLTAQRKLSKGELFNFNLILVGWAVDYIPYFVLVFENLGDRLGIGKKANGKKGGFRVINVVSSGKEIYSAKTKTLSSDFERKRLEEHEPLVTNRIIINFITPTRLQLEDKAIMLKDDAGFVTFIIRLYSRLFHLQSLYCSNGMEPDKYDHHDLETLARKIKVTNYNLHWYDLKRPLNSLNSSKPLNELEWMNYGGFVGEVTFEGELTPFVNMIKLGEHLHVGKYYTFGLGRYEILEIN